MPGVTFIEIKPLPAEYTEITCERNVLKEMHDNDGCAGISLCLMTLILHNTDSCQIIHLLIWALFMRFNIHWKHTIFLFRITVEKVCLHYSNECVCRILWSSRHSYPEHWERWEHPFLLEGKSTVTALHTKCLLCWVYSWSECNYPNPF